MQVHICYKSQAGACPLFWTRWCSVKHCVLYSTRYNDGANKINTKAPECETLVGEPTLSYPFAMDYGIKRLKFYMNKQFISPVHSAIIFINKHFTRLINVCTELLHALMIPARRENETIIQLLSAISDVVIQLKQTFCLLSKPLRLLQNGQLSSQCLRISGMENVQSFPD